MSNESQPGGDELGRRLNEAFDAKARGSVPDHRLPPAMRRPDQVSTFRHGRARWLAPLTAAAAVLVVAVVLGVSHAPHHTQRALGSPRVGSPQVGSPQVGSPQVGSTAAGPTGAPVHVSVPVGDGSQVGVGMPIIAYLSRPIKDAHAFAKATRVTVNGHAVRGGWYFEHRSQPGGQPIEADYRLQTFWPAHSQIHVSLPVKGLSAGPGLVFDDNVSLAFSTGAANILTVNDATHTVTVVSDGRKSGTFPVSLGAASTPTRRGVKVIMEKGRDIAMRGPGYFDPHVRFTQRLTYDGEYLNAAPWNCLGHPGCLGPQDDIGRANSSNGGTDLRPPDAKRLYDLLEIGDVVNYPNAGGPLMRLGDGYGDWNVPWARWRTGGLYRVR